MQMHLECIVNIKSWLVQSNSRSESVTSLVAQLLCTVDIDPLVDLYRALDSNKLPLIITRSHVDFQKLFVWLYVSQVKANKTTVTFLFHRLLQWLIGPDVFQCLCSRPVFDDGHTSQSSTFEAQIGDPPPQSHVSLFFSLATITINSSTSEGSEEQLINHMHPLLVSWRPSWLYWSVSLILHCFDSLFSHPFS